ncbi:hypothetical protein QFZ75_007979 [Streptomyces sp. V3I8]|uniref:hypothetical protein n=1 Tax=Streptomyces sp. V3I8 TaxID=3042279 RepID=UPI002788BC0B|nr:hypothetical protein [Streptomyces sp. V3I8]MDQ1041477.1 hypothetical protein [Streptomyces sp. V3I8]
MPDQLLACSATGCQTTAPRPADCQWAPLWDAGWRWRSDPAECPLRLAPRSTLYSCPAHPPRHYAGRP